MTKQHTNKPAFFTSRRMALWGRNTVCLLSLGWIFPHPELPDEAVAKPAATKSKK